MSETPPAKVAHVMRRFARDRWGGTEAVVSNLARALQARGISSPVYCTAMLSRPGREECDGVSVRRFRYVFPWFGLSPASRREMELKGGSPLAPGLFAALLREPGLSIIHTHVQKRLGGMARTAARLRGIPYVVSLHGGLYTTPADQYRKMEDPFRGKIEWGKAAGLLLGSRRVLDDADAILCVGADEADRVRQAHPTARVHYVPNGVDIARFRGADAAPFRARFRISPADRIVLCVSRIDYQKNQLLLVRAFARFARTRPDWRLVLIGPVTVEDYERQVREAAAHLGIADRLLLIPGFGPDDPMLPSAYRAADIFAFPTSHEPFGIVILEAWAAGRPVIASRVGGIPGFVQDGTDALLFESGSEDALIDRLSTLANQPRLAEAIARAGAEKVEARYSWEAVCQHTLDIYREAIARKAPK